MDKSILSNLLLRRFWLLLPVLFFSFMMLKDVVSPGALPFLGAFYLLVTVCVGYVMFRQYRQSGSGVLPHWSLVINLIGMGLFALAVMLRVFR